MKQNKLFTLFSLTLLSTGTPLTSIVQAGTIIKDAPAITAAPNNDTKKAKKQGTTSSTTDEQKKVKKASKPTPIDDKKNKTVAPLTKSAISEAVKAELLKADVLSWGEAPWVFDVDSGILAIGSGQIDAPNSSPWRRTDGKGINADSIKKIIFVGENQAPKDSSNLFANLSSLNQIVGLEGFDTSKVIEMSRMFQGATALTSLDLSQLNTSKVRSTVDMFEGCTSLTSLNLSKIDTSSLTNLGGMFKNCSSLKHLDLSSFDTSEVTTMRDMFRNTSLTSLTLGDKFHFLGTDSELTLSYPSDALREGKYVTGNWTNKNNNAVSYKPADFIDNYGTNNLKAGTYVAETKSLVWGDVPWAFDKDSGVLTIASGQLDEANNSPWNRSDDKKIDKKQIKKISFTGATKAPKNSRSLFKKLTNLTEIEGLTYLDTSEVTDMSEMFYDCYDLTKLDLSNFNTVKVTNIMDMFFYCVSLETLDLSKFNTKIITNMTGVFQECKSLKSLDLSGFDTSNVTTMEKMFKKTSLSSLKLGNKFRFIGSDSQLPVPTALTPGDQLTGKWIKKNRGSFAHSPAGFMRQYGTKDLSAGTYVAEVKSPLLWGDAPWTFDADSGTLRVESGRLDTSSNSPWNRKNGKSIDKKLIKKIILTGTIKAPTNATNLFKSLNNLTEIKGLSYLDTSEVTTMLDMFRDCSSLTTLNLTQFNTKKVTDMRGMFRACTSLKSLDLSSFDTSGVTTLNKMFEYVPLASLKLGDAFRFKGNECALSTPAMLNKEDKLTGKWVKKDGNSNAYSPTDFIGKYGSGDLKSGTYVAETKDLKWGDSAYSFNADSGVLMVEPGTLSTRDYTPWNRIDGNAIDSKLIKKIIFTGPTKAPVDATELFKFLNNLTEIEGLTNLDTSDVTTMLNMFRDCSSLVTLDLSNFNTAKVTDIRDMFRDCSSLTSLDLSKFNTVKVTDMRGTFRACKSLTSLDLSNFDTSGVNTLNKLFEYAPLASLTLGDNFRFVNTDSNLSLPQSLYTKSDLLSDGKYLTGKWIKKENQSAAYTPNDFIANFGKTDDLKGGTYVAEINPLLWGDAPYAFDTESGTLIINPGTLGQTESAPWNQTEDKKIAGEKIKKIIFTGPTKAPVDATELFKSLNNLTEIEGLTNLDTSDVTTMLNMFRDCSSLVTLDLSNFNTAKVTDIRDMFRDCSSLTSLDLSKFNTAKVTDMRGTFRACKSLTSLDLSSFDTSGVTTLNKLFEYVPLASLTLGDKFKFVGNDCNLSAPAALVSGDQLTGNWIRQDGNSKAYNLTGFTEKYGTGDLKSGTYIAETKDHKIKAYPTDFPVNYGTGELKSGT